MQTPSSTCPRCQSPIPADAPGSLCPSCALLGVAEPTDPAQSAAAGTPTLEELAAAFPEYEMLGVIGQGGMGVVFKARQPRLDRLVALKILPPALAAQPGFAERFTREARALARLAHPHIVAVYDFGERAGFYYLMMEFVNGVNLRQAMRAGVTPVQALALVPRICEALQFAHDRGVLHRDIKPENILLDTAGTPKLADFGIAKFAGDATAKTNLTETGAALGTAAYMSPEQIEKPATVDHRADIYSLGVVLYEMLTGELPLGRFAAPSEKSSVNRGVDEVVMRSLEKERERRQQSASAMKTEVEYATQHSGPMTGAVPPTRALEPLAMRIFTALAALSAIGIPVAAMLRWTTPSPGHMIAFFLIFGVLAGVAEMFSPSARVSAKPRDAANPAPNPWPKRIFVLIVALVVVPMLLLIIGLVVPRLTGRSRLMPALAASAEVRQNSQRNADLLEIAMRDAQARPPAIVTAAHAPFVGELTQGSIELVAITSHHPDWEPGWRADLHRALELRTIPPSAAQQAWRMNGEPALEGPFINFGSKVTLNPGEQACEFVFHTKGLPPDASSLFWEIPESRSSGGTRPALVAEPDKPLTDYDLIAATFPATTRATQIRAGIALDPWHTLAETRPGNATGMQTMHDGLPWKLTFSTVVESKAGETVATYSNTDRSGWVQRLVAVTLDGEEIAPSYTSRLGEQAEARFAHLPLPDVAFLRLQVRPIQWVEFRGVPLTPAPTK